MSADWWLEDTAHFSPCDCDTHSWNLTYNLNRMLWEAGWQWAAVSDEQAEAPQTSLPNPNVWSANWLAGIQVGNLGEKALQVVTNLRNRPDYFKQWNPPNGWGNYDQAVETFKSFLAAIEAHPDASLGCWF